MSRAEKVWTLKLTKQEAYRLTHMLQQNVTVPEALGEYWTVSRPGVLSKTMGKAFYQMHVQLARPEAK